MWVIIEKVPVKIGGHTKWIIDVWTVVFANVADTPERRVDPEKKMTQPGQRQRLQTQQLNYPGVPGTSVPVRLMEFVFDTFLQIYLVQSITFEASDRSCSLPLALSYFPASELSLPPIREIACYKRCLSKR